MVESELLESEMNAVSSAKVRTWVSGERMGMSEV